MPEQPPPVPRPARIHGCRRLQPGAPPLRPHPHPRPWPRHRTRRQRHRPGRRPDPALGCRSPVGAAGAPKWPAQVSAAALIDHCAPPAAAPALSWAGWRTDWRLVVGRRLPGQWPGSRPGLDRRRSSRFHRSMPVPRRWRAPARIPLARTGPRHPAQALRPAPSGPCRPLPSRRAVSPRPRPRPQWLAAAPSRHLPAARSCCVGGPLPAWHWPHRRPGSTPPRESSAWRQTAGG